MKKIAIIIMSDLPVPAVMGGAVEELLTILIEENEIHHKAEFVIFSLANEEAEARAKNYKYTKMVYFKPDSLGDRVINRMNRSMGSMIGKILIDIGFYRKVYDYLKKNPVDAIVAEGMKYQELRRFAQDFGKENLYVHINFHLMCEPYLDGIFGHVIGISNFIRDEWLRTTTDTTIIGHTLYNAVKEEKFTKRISSEEREELRYKLGFNKEDKDTVILYCGRMLEVKGVRELIKAVCAIDDTSIKLLIVGNADFALNSTTPYLQEIKELVEKSGDRVRFTGFVPNEEIYRYYQCADIQCVPSLWEEGAGLVTIEGMLSGLPLIITKSGGMVEYAPEDVAIQVSRDGVVENLKEAIIKLAADQDLQKEMSRKSLEQAKKFPKRKFYEDFVEIFN